MANNGGVQNPAVEAAEKSLQAIYECLDGGKSFLLEAGAGAGKTHSLVMALRHLITTRGREFMRRGEKIACITYTNVASDEISSRTDGHAVVFSSTIHAFCWSLIKDFQQYLREVIPSLPRWQERLDEGGGIAGRAIEYDLGYPSAKKEDSAVSLGHNDILALMVMLLEKPKFRRLLTARYPVLFIDEYQDTNKDFVGALIHHFLETGEGPLIGFFGDHWQRIYGSESCGSVAHEALEIIEQKANFRSARPIVEVLNRIRPELPQAFRDPESKGSVAAYHTNGWVGTRRSGAGGHWTKDLPADDAHAHLEALVAKLRGEGWDFSRTKILMLTHGVLAAEQGYSKIATLFSSNNAAYLNKEDRHLKFLLETVEPVCVAYEKKRYGEMFIALGGETPTIRAHSDKAEWARDMARLVGLRENGTIGEVLDHLKAAGRPRIPEAVARRDAELEKHIWEGLPDGKTERSTITRLRELRTFPYSEVKALAAYLDEHTQFSTKHGVKGAQFENVLVVAGRGWNQYDFNRLLEWLGEPDSIPADRVAFERNRNLFYVACSRPEKRLAVLFTQELSEKALKCLSNFFGEENTYSFVPKA